MTIWQVWNNSVYMRRGALRVSANIIQPTYKRQRFLLAFIRQIQSYVSATDLQKLVFLYIMESGSKFYEFIPYKFGAYSFQLAEDVDILRKNNFVDGGGSRICAAGNYQSEDLFNIAAERGNNLIRKAYREYPYYAINSEIIERLFHDEEALSLSHGRDKYRQTNQVLFTIGYEGRSVEAFINTLITNDIHLLCDVRRNPLSRKFGFSKAKLKHIVETVKIKYVHIPELGIASEKRSELVTKEDYKKLFLDYADTLPSKKQQLDYLYSLLSSNARVALMCFEKDSAMCHRHVIRDYLSLLYPIQSEDL
jgi:hypothetical protein